MSEELDLGTTSASPTTPEGAVNSDAKTKRYPSFTIEGDAYEAFKKKYGPCDVEDTYTAPCKLRVSAIRSDEYNKSITLEVRAIMGDVEEESEEDADEETGNDDAKEASDSGMSKRKKALADKY